MSLQFIMDSQKKFQGYVGHDLDNMTEKERSKYLHEAGYFLIEEITEMLRETPYHKYWKDYSSWDENKFKTQNQLTKEEAIDALHYMINILICLGMDEKEVLKMYKEKNKVNYQRQQDPSLGYVSES